MNIQRSLAGVPSRSLFAKSDNVCNLTEVASLLGNWMDGEFAVTPTEFTAASSGYK